MIIILLKDIFMLVVFLIFINFFGIVIQYSCATFNRISSPILLFRFYKYMNGKEFLQFNANLSFGENVLQKHLLL